MVEDQSDDLWGLAFLLLAVLAGLGIYAGVIGPAGHALRTGTADLFGLARYGLPPGFAVLGGYLILRHARSEPGRVAVGLALALMAAAGLLCVLTGKDTLRQPLAAMGRAGGLVGAAEGVPLQAGLASWGAGLVFGAAGLRRLFDHHCDPGEGGRSAGCGRCAPLPPMPPGGPGTSARTWPEAAKGWPRQLATRA